MKKNFLRTVSMLCVLLLFTSIAATAQITGDRQVKEVFILQEL